MTTKVRFLVGGLSWHLSQEVGMSSQILTEKGASVGQGGRFLMKNEPQVVQINSGRIPATST